MARDIDRKLRLTAALLGTVTVKDLAAAFRRVNAASPFDIERAHKWLQGRACPREAQVYEDWIRVLDLGRSGHWVAESGIDDFLDAICDRHQVERESLWRRVDPSGNAGRRQGHSLPPVGIYACYSHAWSPYFRGRLIRGALSITTAPAPRPLRATYSENLPTGRLQLDGTITMGKRVMHVDLRENGGDAHFNLSLFPPAPPMSVLAGFMCGVTVIGPDPQPSVTRIAIVRLPGTSEHVWEAEAYLPPQGSIAKDLAALGLPITEPGMADRCLDEFLTAADGGLDQIPVANYRALAEIFDPAWLTISGPEPSG